MRDIGRDMPYLCYETGYVAYRLGVLQTRVFAGTGLRGPPNAKPRPSSVWRNGVWGPLWIILHPLYLSGLPSYGFDPIYQGPCTIPDMAVFGPGCRLRPARAKGPKKTDCADVLLKIRSIHRQNSLANQLKNSSAGNGEGPR